MKRKLRSCKILSVFLSIILLLLSLPLTVIALKNEDPFLNRSSIVDPILIDPALDPGEFESISIDKLKALNVGEKTITELKNMTVDLESLPVFIDSHDAVQKGHVNRLKAQETNLNTVIYQNKDGTKTTYIFMKPVKYIDTNGEIKDKSTKVSAVDQGFYSYAMLDNSTHVFFPQTSGNGTVVQFQNYVISMTPKSNYNIDVTYNDIDNTIIYSNVYGESTAIFYQTQLNGLKEDIVLYQNIGENEFHFELSLTKLVPVQIDKEWYLKNSENKIIGSFGKIIVKDSAGNSVEGNMTISATAIRGKYDVAITVPEPFLTDGSTVYPIYVDPSTYIWEEGYYYGYDGYYEYYEEYNAIEDTGLYSTTAGANNAISNPNDHKLGYISSNYGSGKIVYKLYDFFGEHGQHKSLHSYQIGTAYLRINVNSGTAATVTVNPMSSTWSGSNPVALSDSTLWNAYSTEIGSSLYLDSSSGQRDINITAILRGWADYNDGTSTKAYNNPANGFVLSSSSSSTYRTVKSVEDTNTTVCVIMDTSYTGGKYYVNNLITGKFLRNTGNSSLSAYTYYDSDYIRWYFEYIGNDHYYIRSQFNRNYVLYGAGNSVSLKYMPSDPSDNYIWEVRMATGGGVTIKNVYSGYVLKYDGENISLGVALSSSDENYKQTTWGILQVSSYINLTSFTMTNAEWLSVGSAQNSKISVTPSNATWSSATSFEWKSSDPAVATVDSNGRVTAVADGYTNIVAKHKPTGKSYVLPIVVGEMISYGTYQIKNIQSGKYMGAIKSSNAYGDPVQQMSQDGSKTKWRILYYGSGYYCIWSAHNGLYIGVSDESSSSGASIIQTSSVSSASQWKITVTSDGNYKFVAKCAETNNMALSLPYLTTSDGVTLQQKQYTADTLYTDEWFFYYDVSLIGRLDGTDGADRNFIQKTKNQLNILSSCNTFYTAYSSEFTVNEMKTRLSNSKMFVIHTHGNRSLFMIGDSTYYYISNIKQTDMSQLRLVIFLTCSGGEGGYNPTNVTSGKPQNLVEACIYSGASSALAFEQTTYTDACNQWSEDLAEKMSTQNLTLQQAIDALDDPTVDYNEDVLSTRFELSDIAVVGGNKNIKLSDVFS